MQAPTEIIELTKDHRLQWKTCGKRYEIIDIGTTNATIRCVNSEFSKGQFPVSIGGINTGLGFGSLQVCDKDYNPLPVLMVTGKVTKANKR